MPSRTRFARAARSHGQSARYEHEFIGFNYRMQGFQGAILRIKLRRLYASNAKRRDFAREYRRLLDGARVEIPVDDPRVLRRFLTIYLLSLRNSQGL